MKLAEFPTIYVVCTGNTCRSPMAEHLLRRRLMENGIEATVRSRRSLGGGYATSYSSSSSSQVTLYTPPTIAQSWNEPQDDVDAVFKDEAPILFDDDELSTLIEETYKKGGWDEATVYIPANIMGKQHAEHITDLSTVGRRRSRKSRSTTSLYQGASTTHKKGGMAKETQKLLEEHLGPDPRYEEHRERGFTDEELQSADLVLCMDRTHVSDIAARAEGYTADGRLKAITFGDLGGEPSTRIPDPLLSETQLARESFGAYTTMNDRYLHVFEELDRLIAAGLQRDIVLPSRTELFVQELAAIERDHQRVSSHNAIPPGWPVSPDNLFQRLLGSTTQRGKIYADVARDVPQSKQSLGMNMDLREYAYAALALSAIESKLVSAAEEYLMGLPDVFDEIQELNTPRTVWGKTVYPKETEAMWKKRFSIATQYLGKPVIEMAKQIHPLINNGGLSASIARPAALMTMGMATARLSGRPARRIREILLT